MPPGRNSWPWSYTIGEQVAEANRWPVQLADKLLDDGFQIHAPVIIAQNGWTTDELSKAIDEANPTSDYELVTLLIGVNNQYRGRDLASFEQEFALLLNRAIQLAQGDASRVIVVSIPITRLTPYVQEKGLEPRKIASEIDLFNGIAERMSRESGALWANVTDISRARGAEAAMLAEDGLHPSGEMYALWVNEILPLAREILQNGQTEATLPRESPE